MPKESPRTRINRSHRPEGEVPGSPPRTSHRRRGIHWRVPAVMLGSLLTGIAVAVSHHFFYLHYDNRPVRDGTEQRYLSNGGTAFAFLVKMFLAIATSSAYVQQFWLSLKEKPYRLDRVDRLYSVLKDITVFCDLGLWLRNPMLTTLAVVTWILPLAVIVTPGTLTTRIAHETSSLITQPPQLSLDAHKYAVYVGVEHLLRIDDVQGPQSAVMAVTVASAAQQMILPIKPPQPNSSYDLRFIGPAIRCTEPPQSNMTTFQHALAEATKKIFFGNTALGAPSLVYNAWAPDLHHKDLANPNWNNGSSNYIDSAFGVYSGGTLFIYIGRASSTSQGTIVYNEMVLLQCTLYNATYDVGFDFAGTGQSIEIRTLVYGDAVPASSGVPYDITGSTYYDLSVSSVTYTSLLWAFGQLLIGTGTTNPFFGQYVPNYTGTLAQVTALKGFIEGSKGLTFNVVKVTVEQMFQNMTLSLLSSDKFLLASNASHAVNTTLHTAQTVYAYQPKDLYIAYGSGIVCALICVLIGCAALIHNDLPYSSDFTTVVRTTRRQEITDLVLSKDSMGGDPLEKRIGKTVVQFGIRNQDEISGLIVVQDSEKSRNLEKQPPSQTSELVETASEEHVNAAYSLHRNVTAATLRSTDPPQRSDGVA